MLKMSRYVWYTDGHCEYLDEICHYGIKGMRWGVRKSRAIRGTGSGSSRGEPGYQYDSKGHRLLTTNESIETFKTQMRSIYMPFVGLFKLPSALKSIKKTTGQDFFEKDGPAETVNTIRKGSKESLRDAFSKVNYKDRYTPGASYNVCQCVIATDMRTKGYDVRARRTSKSANSKDVEASYKGGHLTPVPVESPRKGRITAQQAYNQLTDALSGDNSGNSRGILMFRWSTGGGHAINYECKDGEVVFYDGVNRRKGVALDPYFVYADKNSYTYMRTDNLEMADTAGTYAVSKKDNERGF